MLSIGKVLSGPLSSCYIQKTRIAHVSSPASRSRVSYQRPARTSTYVAVSRSSNEEDPARARATWTVSKNSQMSYWLLKTEPGTWSWNDQSSAGGQSQWDGVRNAQAQKNMKQMSIGDLCFFYHTGKERAIVGISTVSKSFYPDPDDESGRYGMVDVEEVCALPEPVTLAQVKSMDDVADFALVRQPRLSVISVPSSIWKKICDLGGVGCLEAPWQPGKKPPSDDH